MDARCGACSLCLAFAASYRSYNQLARPQRLVIMRRTAFIVLFTSLGLTLFLGLLWVLGFIFAGSTVGNLIHLLLVLAMVTSVGVFVGVVLLIVSYLKK